jgi:raffinose/stachyose/melibiose transport system substrate-binding protein
VSIRSTAGNPRGRLFALIAAVGIVAAACGGGATSAPATSAPTTPAPGESAAPATPAAELEGKITFLHKYSDPRYAPYFEQVVAAYMAENPKVEIEIQAESDQGVKDKLRVLAASNSLPDIYFSWAGDFTKKFVRSDLARDLTAEVTGDWKSSFTPAALDAYTYDGKLYGVPITLDAKYLVFNKKMLADNGITVPTTQEELLAACDALKAKGIEDPITFGNQFGWPAIHFMTQLNAYYVPPATLAKDYDPATGEFTDPGYLGALNAFADINTHCLTQGANGISHENAQALFLNSTSPMHYIEAVEFQVLTEAGGAPKELADNWDFIKLPPPANAAGDTGALEGAPDGFLVNQSSQHVDIAVDFLKYLTSLDNAQNLVKTLGWLSPVVGSATAENTFPQNVRVVEDITKASSMAIWLDTVTHIYVANAYLDGVQAMLDGTKTPEDVLKDVQAAAAKAKAETQ